MKNILISTGGSGGHVVPATIFYEHLQGEFNMFMTSDDRGIKFLDKDKYNLQIFGCFRHGFLFIKQIIKIRGKEYWNEWD